MKISYTHIACFYVLISFLLDPISAFWRGPSLIILGDVFIITIVSYILIRRKYKSYIAWCLVLLALSCAGMLTTVRYGLNVSAIALVLKNRAIFIFILTILFYMLVFSRLKTIELIKMDFFLERLIQFNIIFLLVEGIALNCFGMSGMFKQIFHESGYRIGAYYGVFGIAPNGLVFGRQNASILSIIAILRWFPWNSDWLKMSVNKSIWLAAAVVSWLITMTTTSIICLVAVIAFIYMLGLARKFRWCIVCLVLLSPLFVVKYYDDYVINKVGHIRTSEEVSNYTGKLLYTFTQPISVMLNEPAELMIGRGNIPQNFSEYHYGHAAKIKSGDIASLILIVTYGALLISVIFFSYIIYVIKVLWYLKKLPKIHIRNGKIILTSFMATMVLILSTIHYATLLQNGMMQLFAFAFALSYVMIKNKKPDESVHQI